VKPSDPPLNTQGGRYKIACPDLFDSNIVHRTGELDIFSHAYYIDDQLQKFIPWMAFKIRVSMPRVKDYPSDKNGFQFMIHMQDFDGFEGEIPQCVIEGNAPEDAPDQPHDHPIRADASFYATKFQQRGNNLVFEPIPMEMLYAPAYRPQVLVKVNGLAAVCPAQNCGYSYVAATSGTITNVQLNGNKVTINAQDFVGQNC
jgi:hypothetical protein